MSLKEFLYSVLIVSSSDKFNSTAMELLPETTYSPVQISKSVNEAKQILAEHSFDYVIINSPLPDDAGIRFAIDAGNTTGTVVLILVRAELHAEIYDKVRLHGVFTLPKPTSKSTVSTALMWMSSARERIRRTEKQTLSIEEKMEEIRIVNRAKWLLINQLHMNEPEAHKYIEKQAMDRCVTKRRIAEEILKIYS